MVGPNVVGKCKRATAVKLQAVELLASGRGSNPRPRRDSVSKPDFCGRPWTKNIHVSQWVTSFRSSADVRLDALESSAFEGTVRARRAEASEMAKAEPLHTR